MTRVVIAFGSNVGDSLAAFRAALDSLKPALERVVVSAVYRTAPMYELDQPAFLNAACQGWTWEGPIPLLRRLKRIERDLGRRERTANGPREIDLDIIVYGALRYRYFEMGDNILTVPHPRVAERRFVLAPMNDLEPSLVIPGAGTVCELLEQTIGQASNVVRLEDAVLPIRR